MQQKDLEAENQYLRHLLANRDEIIAKMKFYISDELKGAGHESAGLIAHELMKILAGSSDPRKDNEHGEIY